MSVASVFQFLHDSIPDEVVVPWAMTICTLVFYRSLHFYRLESGQWQKKTEIREEQKPETRKKNLNILMSGGLQNIISHFKMEEI